jgi:hypothetical protein
MSQFGYREMFGVGRDQGEVVLESGGSNQRVREGELDSLFILYDLIPGAWHPRLAHATDVTLYILGSLQVGMVFIPPGAGRVAQGFE